MPRLSIGLATVFRIYICWIGSWSGPRSLFGELETRTKFSMNQSWNLFHTGIQKTTIMFLKLQWLSLKPPCGVLRVLQSSRRNLQPYGVRSPKFFWAPVYSYSCSHWLRPRNSPLPPHLGSYTKALLVSQDRRHLDISLWPPASNPPEKTSSFSKHEISVFFPYFFVGSFCFPGSRIFRPIKSGSNPDPKHWKRWF